MFRNRSILIWSVDPCVVVFLVSIWTKGALSLEIDEIYFINNIDDDGSYGWNSGDETYTKTITADNLEFSIDNDGKLHAKLKPFRPDFSFMILNFKRTWVFYSDIILSHTIDTKGAQFSIGTSTVRLL